MGISKISLTLSISYTPKLKKKNLQIMTEISLRGKDTCESVTPAVFKGNSFAFRKEKRSISEERMLHTGITNISDTIL